MFATSETNAMPTPVAITSSGTAKLAPAQEESTCAAIQQPVATVAKPSAMTMRGGMKMQTSA
jgi:hypothetical protein